MIGAAALMLALVGASAHGKAAVGWNTYTERDRMSDQVKVTAFSKGPNARLEVYCGAGDRPMIAILGLADPSVSGIFPMQVTYRFDREPPVVADWTHMDPNVWTPESSAALATFVSGLERATELAVRVGGVDYDLPMKGVEAALRRVKASCRTS